MSDLEQGSQNENEGKNAEEVLLADGIKLTLLYGVADKGEFPVLKFEFMNSHTRTKIAEVRYLAFVEDLMNLSNLIAKCGFDANKHGCA